MKKVLVYFFVFILVCFAIPIIFTRPEKRDTSSIIVENQVEESKIPEITYDYKKYTKIKLLHESNKKIEEITLDEYLYGVVSAEMPANYDIEALKAQAVVARTYTLYKIVENDKKHEKADICDNSACCQAWISKKDRLTKWDEKERENYWNKIVMSVNTTQGKMITYEGKPINAFFHANSGGATEPPINVWGGKGYPYLQTVTTSGEDAYSGYSSNVTVTQKEFKEKIKKEHSNFMIDFKEKDCIKIQEYTAGNRVKSIKVGNLTLSGVEIRNIFELRSANFKVSMEKEKIKFEVIGYGHGVGMSQTGADSLAKQGKNYQEIINHYYTGIKIEDIV